MSKSILPGGRITNRAGRERPRFIRPVERQRMRPWLEEHLDKNDIPGLSWVTKNERIFRIAWKHAANQCFNLQKDTNLFERWAIHTGRHYDSDHKRWKANFRCALNSLPDVKENKEQGIKKGNNAYKVYRFLDEKEPRGAKETKVKKRPVHVYDKEGALMPSDYETAIIRFEKVQAKEEEDDCGNTEPISVDDEEEGESSNIPSIPKLDQLYPSTGVEMLIEAGYKGSKEKVEPLTDTSEDTNLTEILAAATASLAAGSDPAMLENISINQLKRLGEVSLMRLDVRQNVKKNSSGYMYVFLCRWCEKVFPRKIELFQHFLITHQEKLLAGEEYGSGEQATHDKSDPKHQKLLQEIQDLELKVLGFSEKAYQSSEADSEEASEEQSVPTESSASGTGEAEDKALDLTMKAKASKNDPKQETALDLSLSTAKKHKLQKPLQGKRRRSSQETELSYSVKFGNYGIAGKPRTKRQMSLHTRKKEEEQERMAKKILSTDGSDPSRQHSMEDIVHAEMLLSLKSGNDEGSDKSSVKSVSKKENSSKGKKGKSSGKRSSPKSQQQKALLDREKMVGVLRDSDDELEQWTKMAVKEETDSSSSVKAFKCGLCYQRFTNASALQEHVESHSGTFAHICNQCGKKCKSHQELLEHVGFSHPSITHRCNFCWKLCRTVKKLKNHMWLHISVCKKCGERFYNPELLDAHMQEQHGVKPSKKRTTTTATTQKQQQKTTSIKMETETQEAKASEVSSSDGITNEALSDEIVNEEEMDDEEQEEEDELAMDNESNATTEIAEDSDNDPDDNVTDILGANNNMQSDMEGSGKADNPDDGGDVTEDSKPPEGKQNGDTGDKGDDTKVAVVTDNEPEDNAADDSEKGDLDLRAKGIPNLEILTSNDTVEETQADKDKERTKTMGKGAKGEPVSTPDIKLEKTSDDEIMVNAVNSSDTFEKAGTDDDVIQKTNPGEGGGEDAATGISEVADRIKAAEKMLNLINDTSATNTEKDSDGIKQEVVSSTDGTAVESGTDPVKDGTDPDIEVYKSRARELMEKMYTMQIGNCLICAGAVPMTLMIAHIKTHSIVELSKAKEALELLDIKINALERPLYLCNLCNFGFDTCDALSTHVGKHLAPPVKHKGTGGKKRKLEADKHKESAKAKLMKTIHNKSKSAMAAKKSTQSRSFTSTSSDKVKVVELYGKKEGVNSGSILAAYLNAGPKYQTSALAKLMKQPPAPQDIADKATGISAEDQKDLTGPKLIKTSSVEAGIDKTSIASITGYSKDKKDIENALANTQCIAIPSQSGTVLLSVNNKGDGGGGTKDGPTRPIPLMFLKEENSPDLKIVPATSLMQLSQELGSNIKGSQVLKVIPPGLLQNQLGKSALSTSLPDLSNTPTTHPSVMLNSVSTQITPSTTSVSSPQSITLTPSSINRSIVVSRPVVGEGVNEGAGPQSVFVVPSTVLRRLNESGETELRSAEDKTSTEVFEAGTQDPDVRATGKECTDSENRMVELPTTVPRSLPPPQSVTATLPTSILHGQNLPASLQHGQVRLISSSGGNQSGGQITILKWPMAVQMGRIAGSSAQGIKTTKLPGSLGIGTQVNISQTSCPTVNVIASTVTTASTASSSSFVNQSVSNSGIGISPSLAAKSNTFPMESLLVKKPSTSGQVASAVSGGSSSSSPLISVFKPQSSVMNVMLSQYLQSQGVLGTSNANVRSVSAGKTGISESTGAMSNVGPKPTFNLVITQTPLTQSTTTTTSNQSAAGGSGLVKGLSVGSNQENQSETGSGSQKMSATVTQRLALVCNLCMTEIQNLEMISQHVCPGSNVTPPTTQDATGEGGSGVAFPCIVCNKDFYDLDIILAHQRGHNLSDKELIRQCKLCSKCFLNDMCYRVHMKTCHENRTILCPLCGRNFSDQKSCIEHLDVEHAEETKCDICKDSCFSKRLFLSASDLALHKIYSHPFECTSCDFRCDKEKELWSHILNHPKLLKPAAELKSGQGHGSLQSHEQGVICKKCLVGFVSLQTFQSHVRVLHPGESFTSLMEENPEKCHLCDFSFKHKKTLHQHLENFHMRKLVYFCSVCNKNCTTPSQLVAHLKDHLVHLKDHLNHQTSLDIEFCHMCHKIFPHRIFHVTHMHSHGIWSPLVPSKPLFEASPPEFELDASTFSLQTVEEVVDTTSKSGYKALTDKPLVIDAEEPLEDTGPQFRASLKCETCGIEGFKSKFLLKQHQVIRHIHPHARTSSSYYQHVIENIKRPKYFYCRVCGAKFDNKNALRLHKNCKKIPQKVRQKLYGCALCKKSFHKLMKLTKHLWIHEEQSTESITTDGGNGSAKDSSNNTNEAKRFMCNVCMVCFVDSAGLFQHAKCHLDKTKLVSVARSKLKHALTVTGDPMKLPSTL